MNRRQNHGASLLRGGPFSRLFWAGFITSTGDWAALFAQITLAGAIGGATGILVVLAARLLPGLVGGAIGGVLADRVSRKVVIVSADLLRGVVVLSLAFVERLPELFAIAMLLEMLTLLGQPARAAAIPHLVDENRLLGANSLMLTAAYGTFPLGAAVSWMLGLLPALNILGIPATTEAKVFALDAVTFIASGLILLTIPLGRARIRPERRRESPFDMRAPLRDLVEGMRFVGGSRQVRTVVFGMSIALVGGGILIVLGQGFVEDVLRADEAGFFAMLTALGTGGAVGIAGLTFYGHALTRRDVAFGFALSITGVALVAASLVKTVPGGMGWMAVMGLGAGASYVLGFTHLHEQVDHELQGRTFAALFSLMRAGLLASMALATAAVDVIDGRFRAPFDNATRDVLFVGGVIVFVSGVGALWSRRSVFRRPRVSHEDLATLEEASQMATLIRGRAGTPPEDEDLRGSGEAGNGVEGER